jgi:hypothetical protein
MEGLHFFIAVTESDRQTRHSLYDVTPHRHDEAIAAPGRLARLRTFLQRVTATRPAARVLPTTVKTGDEAGRTGLRSSVSSTAN